MRVERGMSEADGARRRGEGAHVGSGEAVGRDAIGMHAMQRRRMSKVVTKAAGCGPHAARGKARARRVYTKLHAGGTRDERHGERRGFESSGADHVVPCGAGHVAIGSDGRSPHVLSVQ